MLIHSKDDILFVTEFPCFLGHPVYKDTNNTKVSNCVLPAETYNRIVSFPLLDGAHVYSPACSILVLRISSLDIVVLGEASHSWETSGPIIEVVTRTPVYNIPDIVTRTPIYNIPDIVTHTSIYNIPDIVTCTPVYNIPDKGTCTPVYNIPDIGTCTPVYNNPDIVMCTPV